MEKGIKGRLRFVLLAAAFLWGFIVPNTQAQIGDSFYWQNWEAGTHGWSDCTDWSDWFIYTPPNPDPYNTCPDIPGNNDVVSFNSYGYYWLMTGDVRVLNPGSLDLWALEMDNFRENYTFTFELGGGSLSAHSITIGEEWHGQSVFQHTGGTNTVNFLNVGRTYDEDCSPSNGGHYILQHPGELTVNYETVIGDLGNGTFTQTSGSHTVLGDLYLGKNYDEYCPVFGTGTFELGGGTLDVGANEFIGNFGTGVFNQTGGTHSVGGHVYVSAENTSIGTYSLSAGTHEIGNNLYVGFHNGSDGTYNLSSTGTLSVGGDEYIGGAGDAVFNQTGGTHTITGNLYCDPEGDENSNTAAFNQLGGSLTVWEVIIGSDCVDNYVSGTRTILGGTTLKIYGGIFNWEGGELIVGTILNDGTFNVSGASGEVREVNHLVLAPGSTLNVSGVTLYYNELEDYGGTINTSGEGSVGPAPGANNPPVADANGPYTGTVGTPVSLNGSGSIDPDGTIVLYEWDFDGDGTFDFSSASSPTASHTYLSATTYDVTLRVTDDGGLTDTDTTTASIGEANHPPVADANGPYVANEGETVTLDASGSYDPDEAEGDSIILYEWDLDNDGEYDDATGITAQKSYEDDGSDTVGLRVTDKNGASDTATAIVTVNNVAPSVGPISIDPEEALVEVDTSITASADFTDPGVLDTHTAVWNWGDGNTESGTVIEGGGSGSVSDGHSYNTAGVYTVELTVTDDDGGLGASVFQYVVVYDPTGGFVTGGGWIESPEGAYAPDPLLMGKATFGFVSKYKKGATTPTGNTEFQFKAGDLNFHSSSYEWLVVTGSDYARFKGSGTINGMGDYKFMVWAGDSEPDTFRIKIWEEDEFGVETVIYDNGMDQAIGGGSIVVHKAK